MGSRLPQRCLNVVNDSTYLPFLYFTRTLIAPNTHRLNSLAFDHHSRRRGTCLAKRAVPMCFSAQACRYSTRSARAFDSLLQDTPSSEDASSQSNDTQRPSTSLSRHGPQPRTSKDDGQRPGSTMTPSEKRAFMRLMKDIKLSDSTPVPPVLEKIARKASKADHKPRKQQQAAETSSPKSSAFAEEDVDDDLAISGILDSSLKGLREDRQASSTVGPEPQTSQSTREDTPRHPPHIAQSSPENAKFNILYGKLKRFQHASFPLNPDDVKIAPLPLATLLAQRESNKICKELDDAVESGKGDFEIWRICQNRIFAMLNMVDLEEAANPSWDPAKPLDTTPSEQADGFGPNTPETFPPTSKNFRTEDPPLDIPPDVPTLTVITIAYPQTLMHALKLLHTHYPLSPFAKHLPDAVKSHSRFSSLVGATTEFYNAVISFHWDFYSDLPHIISLIQEMDVNGVQFNYETLRIVNEIRDQRKEATRKAEENPNDTESASDSQWWDSEALRAAYRELVGSSRKNGWLTKIRESIRREVALHKRRQNFQTE